ncbi:TLC domain-containing protein [Chytriomyces sp. MP71]|nr:TLC domain-containing protein [Chytriomyces sp. MP71]
MSFEWPAYIDFPTDLLSIAGWTLTWAIAHALLHRLVIVPLSDQWFEVPTILSLQSSTKLLDPSPQAAAKAAPAAKAGLTQRKKPARAKTEEAVAVSAEELAAAVKSVNSTKKKFRNAAWKCFVYAVSSVVGFVVLFSDSWWKDPSEWMLDYPDPTTALMKIYYNVGFGNYMYQTLSLITHPNQTDFLAMCMHHVSTVAVITASYCFGFTRVGIVILLLHDCSDPIMEFAKCNLYLKKQKTADNLFTLFAIVFIATRNILFPYVIRCSHIYSILEDGTRMPRGYSFWGNFCLGCLWVLAALNFYWGFLIIKIAIKTVITGEVEGDIREADEDDD